MRGILLVAGLVGLLALAGCIGVADEPLARQAAPDPSFSGEIVRVADDPADDAREGRPEAYQTTRWRCYAVLDPRPVYDACRNATDSVGPNYPLPDEGVPAVAALDIQGVALGETPAYLVVELELGELDPSFREALPRDGESVGFFVGLGEERAFVVSYLFVTRDGDRLEFQAVAYTGACRGTDFGCSWSTRFELEEGSPGRIRWFVERDLLPPTGAGAAIQESEALVLRVVPVGSTMGWRVGNPASDVRGLVLPGNAFRVDHALGDAIFMLTTPPAPLPDRSGEDGLHEDVDGDADAAPDRADLDILRFGVVETPETITLAVELSRVEEAPRDHWLEMDLGVLGGGYVEIYLEAAGGTYHDYSSVSPKDDDQWRTLPLDLVVTPGEPGWVNASFSRYELGAPRRGDVTRYLDVEIGTLDWRDVVDAGVVKLSLYHDALTAGDEPSFDDIDPAPPYLFRHDTLEGASGGASAPVVAEDAVDDVDPNPPAATADVQHFDVTFLEIRPEEPGLNRFTLGVRDLSQVSVPIGYEAAVYAASVETELGPFMVGFYLERGGRQEFFCSQDTLVFATPQQDPVEVVRQPVDGSVSVVDRADEDGGPQASAITFLAPNACFSLQPERPLVGTRMGAGTYLVQDPLRVLGNGRVTTLDTVLHDEPLALQATSLDADAAPWIARPFGLANFWDISGVALALAFAGTGTVLVRRRHGVLKRYLNEVQAVVVANPKSARAREAGLLDVRARVKGDLVRGRISESHFVIVEQRIERELSGARVQALMDLFGDLPHRLVTHLKEMLADGALSAQDYRVLLALLDESALRDEAKAGIREKLRAWLVEDEERPRDTPPRHELVKR